MSWVAAGKLVTSSYASAPAARGGQQRRQGELEGDAAGQVPLARDQRVQLPDPADLVVARQQHAGAAAGVQEGLLRGLDRHGHAEAPEQRLQHRLRREVVRLSRRGGPVLRRRAGREVARDGGAPRPARRDRPRSCPPSAPGRSLRSPPRYTWPDSNRATWEAPRARLSRAASSRLPSSSVRSTDCSAESGLPTSISSRRGSPSGRRSRPATPGSVRLQPTISSAPVARTASSASRRRTLLGRQPADALAGGRQRRGQGRLQVREPGDLLDQVDLAGDVRVALRGDRGRDLVAVALDPEAEPLEAGRAGVAVDGEADDPLHPRHAQAHDTRLGLPRPLVDRAGHEPRAAELDHQLRRDPLRPHRQRRVELLLEARGGLGAQAELAGGAQDVDPVPGRDLEQDARGRL